MKHYIVVMRDDRLWLVGPFGTQQAAADWGADRANNPADDPRWQTIELNPERIVKFDATQSILMVAVLTPAEGAKRVAAEPPPAPKTWP